MAKLFGGIEAGCTKFVCAVGSGPDDIRLLVEFVDPPLMTIRLPAAGLGWGAADLLTRLMTREDAVRAPSVTLEAELVVRESWGAIRFSVSPHPAISKGGESLIR